MDSDYSSYRFFDKETNKTLDIYSVRLDPDLNIDAGMKEKLTELAGKYNLAESGISFEPADKANLGQEK